jgi:hypothetical protein
MSEPPGKKVILGDVHTIHDWVFFVIGAAAQACYAPSGDERRDERSRWAGRTLTQLMPSFAALLEVAQAHPEGFGRALGEPIEVERMP